MNDLLVLLPTGGVYLTSFDSLVGVDNTNFEDEFLAIGRRDIPEPAEPRVSTTGGVDLTGSVGFVGVDKATFGNPFVAIDRHDT